MTLNVLPSIGNKVLYGLDPDNTKAPENIPITTVTIVISFALLVIIFTGGS